MFIGFSSDWRIVTIHSECFLLDDNCYVSTVNVFDDIFYYSASIVNVVINQSNCN